MKHLALITILCTLFSCRNTDNGYARLIKGDWIALQQSRKDEHHEAEFLSFEDSTCRAGIGEYSLKYNLVNDSLYLTNPYNEVEDSYTSLHDRSGKFKIISLAADALVLLSGKHQRDTVRYSKVHSRNSITPAAIYYADPGCYDDCPITVLEIDSFRNVRFFGTSFTALGAYKAKLNENVYQSIIDKIRALPVELLNDTVPDKKDKPMWVSIVHDNRVTRLSDYKYGHEPMELHILLEKLRHLHEEVNQQLDTSLKVTYFNANPIITSMMGEIPKPPVAPAPANMMLFTPPKLED